MASTLPRPKRHARSGRLFLRRLVKIVMIEKQVEKLLKKYASRERAMLNARYFKTGKGEYGEGDIFLGVTVPDTRKVVKELEGVVTLSDLESLLRSPLHEVRLVSALLYVSLYLSAVKEGNEKERKSIAKSYCKNAKYFNNWDLVDTSASQVLGEELLHFMSEGERETILKKLMTSKNLWENRVAVVCQHAFIKRALHELPFSVIERSLHHPHDLMHKANGWMLREIGKFSGQEVLDTFLDKHGCVMPRTTLRYALEHYYTKKRERYMKMRRPTM